MEKKVEKGEVEKGEVERLQRLNPRGVNPRGVNRFDSVGRNSHISYIRFLLSL